MNEMTNDPNLSAGSKIWLSGAKQASPTSVCTSQDLLDIWPEDTWLTVNEHIDINACTIDGRLYMVGYAVKDGQIRTDVPLFRIELKTTSQILSGGRIRKPYKPKRQILPKNQYRDRR